MEAIHSKKTEKMKDLARFGAYDAAWRRGENRAELPAKKDSTQLFNISLRRVSQYCRSPYWFAGSRNLKCNESIAGEGSAGTERGTQGESTLGEGEEASAAQQQMVRGKRWSEMSMYSLQMSSMLLESIDPALWESVSRNTPEYYRVFILRGTSLVWLSEE